MTDDVVVALDVGGTGIKCALLDAAGRVRHSERHATGRERGSDAVVTTILETTERLVRTAGRTGLRPEAVGIAVPAVIDEAAGVAVWSANLGFRDVPLRQLVTDRVGLPTVLGHDVRVGGLAEARLGAGRGYRHVLFVAIGTGIAAAHVVDGDVFAGAHGAAGELGHVVVRPAGPACGCGLRGCLETLASAAAVSHRYAQRAATRTGERPVDADRVAALATAGDPTAAAVWGEAIDALADGLLTGLTLFDPEAVVVGGGLAEAGAALLTPLGSALRERLRFQREPALLPAALGDTAGCLGAGLIARDALNRVTAA